MAYMQFQLNERIGRNACSRARLGFVSASFSSVGTGIRSDRKPSIALRRSARNSSPECRAQESESALPHGFGNARRRLVTARDQSARFACLLPSPTPVRSAGVMVEKASLRAGDQHSRLIASQLPGQDSNLEKQDQNLL